MIMTVTELRSYITTEENDAMLQMKLDAVEKIVQNHTHNNFHKYANNGEINYPADIKLGAINLLKWDMDNRDKIGIQSETISRHSVTYADANGDNYVQGYPRALMGFLRPYVKARF